MRISVFNRKGATMKIIRNDGEVIEGEIIERDTGYRGFRVVIKTADGRFINIPECSIKEIKP